MIHDISYYKKIQNAYESASKKETLLRAATKSVRADFYNSMNWERVAVDGAEQDVLITPAENERTKEIKSKPGEALRIGHKVEWAHTHWLITKMDFDDQLHCAGEMSQCNTILRWQDENGEILSEYGVAEDATKYGTGITNTVYLQTGQFSLKVKVPLNVNTLAINRDRRFLIGEYGDKYKPTAFVVTRLNQVTGSYDLSEDPDTISHGYIEVTMMEDEFREGKDNPELCIADYFEPGASAGGEAHTETEKPEDGGEWF